MKEGPGDSGSLFPFFALPLIATVSRRPFPRAPVRRVRLGNGGGAFTPWKSAACLPRGPMLFVARTDLGTTHPLPAVSRCPRFHPYPWLPVPIRAPRRGDPRPAPTRTRRLVTGRFRPFAFREPFPLGGPSATLLAMRPSNRNRLATPVSEGTRQTGTPRERGRCFCTMENRTGRT